ncbi:MAG: hypothetical protein A2289_09310 [Deltaproteobacteria bacterium RIFOXYA12_FULL_58_15]|nr:MAG: hypothetical protein A2289_09310 [Deltaproteobacteria bacterium RIFOXYA12_FULL_58_15]OGR12231.1 MAG: hypothetical protein A2341_21100 [Deltaproteobacteria bacterium RIFOXYB12_FULL_58_9]
MSAVVAPQSFASIAACADERGLQVSEFDDSIHVRVDETAWVQYMIQVDAYNMVLIVDDKVVPPNEIEAKFTAVKTTGDEIFQCALGHMNLSGPSTGNAPVAGPAPAPVAAPVGATATCSTLFTCYAALARDLCDASASPDCRTSFEVKIEGNDDDACKDAFKEVPMLVEPFKMAKPGFVIPVECK